MFAPNRSRRRALFVAVATLVVLMTAGISGGQVGQISRAIGEVVGAEPDVGREAVGPGDLIETEGKASSASNIPDALAFADPQTSDSGGSTPLPDEGQASSVAGGAATPQASPATPVVPDRSTPNRATPAPVRAEVQEDPNAAVPTGPDVQPDPVRPEGSSPSGDGTPAASDDSGPANVVGTDGRIRGGQHDGRDLGDALQNAQPGERFLFAAGDHAPLQVIDVHGTSDSPIVFGAADPSAPPRFTSGSYASSAGVFVSDSSDLVFQDLEVRRSLWGVLVEGSSGVVLDRLDVQDLGQEGVRVADRSSWITIRNSTVGDTGRRPGQSSLGQPYSNFGEGIYLGTGSTEDDPVSNVVISGNEIFRTSTEAIDIKAPVTNVVVRDNNIRDINTGTSGAIVVHLAADQSAVNPNIRIERNDIRNITTRTQWRDGVGVVVGASVDIVNNTFHSIEHYGIRVEDGGPQGANITARVEGNAFTGIGIDALWAVDGSATLEISGNSGLG